MGFQKTVNTLESIRTQIRSLHRADEKTVIQSLVANAKFSAERRANIHSGAVSLVKAIRTTGDPGLMEVFLAQYGLSTEEGVALMCLAEALLRVPDDQTIDDLIDDKISPSSWGEHLGSSSSSLVNASTWALMLSGKVLKESESTGVAEVLHNAVKRLGEPLIRVAVQQAMKEMGHQFVLGRTIEEALERGQAFEEKGYTYSYDMLGEAALTSKDATTFFHAYCDAIRAIAVHAGSTSIEDNPGISIKLSALHPRYEVAQKARVMDELVPRVRELAVLAKNSNLGLNIDAEEADRLDLSMDVIEAVFQSRELDNWDGFGVVVQAYGKRASSVIDWLYSLAVAHDRKIMVRLVKGAYWDSEIKIAQVDGVEDFPVFSHKSATDVSYICCAQKLLGYTDRIYPQFATHNAHSVSAILEMTNDKQSFEFQRLHGMGEALHQVVLDRDQTRCRIYAPVGAHRDLLAYLVRRLLENGANSSFVNQIVDTSVSPEEIAQDPFTQFEKDSSVGTSSVSKPQDLFLPERINSKGWDLRNFDDINRYELARRSYKNHVWIVAPLIDAKIEPGKAEDRFNPADLNDKVGTVSLASEQDVDNALQAAQNWSSCEASQRGKILDKAADLYEENFGELVAVLCREAAKTPLDAVSEIREAVDFLRYYAVQAQSLEAANERGLITCISPWNFPLAIFTGQISAALAAGNGVLAKPADPTPIIAYLGVKLLYKAGVPENVLQLVPGPGSVVGAILCSDSRINGVCFTGSTSVAQTINNTMASKLEPDATFIAETGGLNAMIVDSTALPEQAIQDIVVSSFQSAGQRCSALRLLYLQRDIADEFLQMLYGAMDQLHLGLPWEFTTDVGPVISHSAQTEIDTYVENAEKNGRLLKRLKKTSDGYFVCPSVIKVDGISDLEKEIFGPVLHVATFEAEQIDQIVADINASGYGLTFGLHTRIDDRVEQITKNLDVGNIYVNRNQIGAIVGSQPFGGEGLSGTGPKAGGPHYVPRFLRRPLPCHDVVSGGVADVDEVQALLNVADRPQRKAISVSDLPGPTGESNRLGIHAKGTVLCLGPSHEDALQQERMVNELGCSAVVVVPGVQSRFHVEGYLERQALSTMTGFVAVALWSNLDDLVDARVALAARTGPIIPLLMSKELKDLCVLERHVCIDTTAAGGNASLLAAQ